MKRVLINSIFNSGKFAVAMAIAFVVSPIIVHSLGNERYGLWSLVISITGYYSILEFGVRTAVVKYVSHYHARQDLDSARSVYTTAAVFFALVGALVLVLSIIIGSRLDQWFEIPSVSGTVAFLMVVVLGSDLAARFAYSSITASLQALQEFPVLSGAEIVTNLAKNGILVALLWQGYGLLMMAGVTLAASIARLLLLQWFLRRRHPFLRFDSQAYDKSMFELIFTYSVYSFVIAMAGKFMFYSGSVIIGKMISVSEVTFYSIAATLLIQVEALVWAAVQVLMPVISGYDASGRAAEIRRLYVVGSRYTLAVSLPVMVSLFSVGEAFISNWMGPEYAVRCGPVLRILTVGYLFQFSQFLAEVVLKGMNRHKILAFVQVAQALIAVALGLSLVGRHGVVGVALGVTIPLVVANLAVIPFFTSRILGMSLWRFLREGVAAPAALVAVFGLIYRPFAEEVSTYSDIVLYGVAVTACFALGSWFLILEPEHRQRLIVFTRTIVGEDR